VEPLSPARYRVQFTASAELHDELERLQALLRHEVPDGDLAAIIEQAVTEKLERLETRRYAKTSAPRKALSQTHTSPASRHIPAAVRCARATETAATTSTSRVDAVPGGTGSSSITSTHSAWAETTARRTSACCAHNAYLAERDYGQSAMGRHRRSAKAARPALHAPGNRSGSVGARSLGG
jgi:hypothetical protein